MRARTFTSTLRLGAASASFSLMGAASAATPDQRAFEARWDALKRADQPTLVVKSRPTEDLERSAPSASPILISGGRMDIYTPPLITPSDISAVIKKHMVDVRRCYEQQLAEDPAWADRLILDLAIKKTGRVTEVSIAPRRTLKTAIGRCLMAQVPNWEFPRFTGETDDGVVQEVVTASFPFHFSVD